MQRHQCDVIVRIKLVGIGNECNLFQKFVNLSKFGSDADQFVDVLFSPRRFHSIFGLQLTHIPTSIERVAQYRARTIDQKCLALVDQLIKCVNASLSSSANPSFGSLAQRKRKRNTALVGIHINFADRRVADASLWHVQNSFEAYFVKRVVRQPQIRKCILDFAAIIKLGPSNDLVRHSAMDERLFKHTTLRIGAIKNCKITPWTMFRVVHFFEPINNPVGLAKFVISKVTNYFFAFT